MSYDLYWMRRRGSDSAESLYEAMVADEEAESPPPARADRLIDRRAVADALLGLGLGFEEADGESEDIELDVPEGEEPGLQVQIFAGSVAVGIPYSPMEGAQVEGLRRFWAKALPALARFDLVGWDPQLDCEIGPETLEATVECINDTAGRFRRDLAPPKPWWKLW